MAARERVGGHQPTAVSPLPARTPTAARPPGLIGPSQATRQDQAPPRRQGAAAATPLQVLRRARAVALAAVKESLGHVEALLEPLQEPPGRRPEMGHAVPAQDCLEKIEVEGGEAARRLHQFLQPADVGGSVEPLHDRALGPRHFQHPAPAFDAPGPHVPAVSHGQWSGVFEEAHRGSRQREGPARI